jgi:methylenetetrahydrofolate reductase (NADPH)
MTFREKLRSGQFALTAELFPPKGTDLTKLKSKAGLVKPFVDAINVTDNQRAVMRIAGIAVARTLIDLGLEPIYQLTCRDRNRLALQSDLLAAHVLGIRNVLLLSGDHPTLGDHKDALPVYDLDTIQLIAAAKNLNSAKDMLGRDLRGGTDFFIGAVVNPNLEPIELQLAMMEKKISAGAEFFQSQVCLEKSRIRPFLELAHKHGVKMLASVSLFSSPNQMDSFRNMGVLIPDPVADRIRGAAEPLKESIRIAAEMIEEFRKDPGVDGIHIIAINIEENIPALFEKK